MSNISANRRYEALLHEVRQNNIHEAGIIRNLQDQLVTANLAATGSADQISELRDKLNIVKMAAASTATIHLQEIFEVCLCKDVFTLKCLHPCSSLTL